MDTSHTEEADKIICTRYEDAINYYWNASKDNKRWYKITRSLTVVFGALVTLVASLTSSKIITETLGLETLFSLGTPILAAMLTIIAGFSQSFQWGSTWQNMVLTAQQLQKEYDVYLVTPVDKRNHKNESEKLNAFVIAESEGFFERMLGGAKPVSKIAEHTNSAAEEK